VSNKEYKSYLKSNEWAQIRIDLFSLRGRKCERCPNTKTLQIHHKTYKNIFKEEPSDLIILCGRCHRSEHFKPKKVKKALKPKKRKKKNKNPYKLKGRDRKLQKKYDQLRAKGIIK